MARRYSEEFMQGAVSLHKESGSGLGNKGVATPAWKYRSSSFKASTGVRHPRVFLGR